MRLRAPERRQQLLDAAKRLVGRQGFHSLSIESVAREAGITRPIIYTHFDDLRGLMEALIDRELVRALDQLAAVLPASLAEGDPAQVLLGALRGYLEVVRADPVTWRLVLMPPEGAPAVLRDHITKGRAEVVAGLTSVVATGLRSGWQSPDPELTARLLSAVADDGARLVLTDPDGYPVERILRHAAWALEQVGGSASAAPLGSTVRRGEERPEIR
jgi:AcrR family transcriptional regulator